MDIDQLSAVVVHDVKNRLAEVLLRLEARGDAQPEVAMVAASAQRLTELLLLQRDGVGQLQANLDAGHPGELLEDIAAEYTRLFPHLQCRVDVEAAPEVAFFDPFLLRLALADALHNGYRHARSGIVLRAASEAGWTVLEVADDGPGFPQEMLRGGGAQPLPPGPRGTGLGLYLAARIAGLHRLDDRVGRIELLNRAGAVFRMLLP